MQAMLALAVGPATLPRSTSASTHPIAPSRSGPVIAPDLRSSSECHGGEPRAVSNRLFFLSPNIARLYERTVFSGSQLSFRQHRIAARLRYSENERTMISKKAGAPPNPQGTPL